MSKTNYSKGPSRPNIYGSAASRNSRIYLSRIRQDSANDLPNSRLADKKSCTSEARLRERRYLLQDRWEALQNQKRLVELGIELDG